jgi:hypothetical protein
MLEFNTEMASNSINAILANMSSNMVTMYPTFRTGIWKRFWDLASSWASSHGPINAVIGPVFDSLSPFGIADDMDVRRQVKPSIFEQKSAQYRQLFKGTFSEVCGEFIYF